MDGFQNPPPTVRVRVRVDYGSMFRFLKSSARLKKLKLCKLGKETRWKWGETGKKPSLSFSFFPLPRFSPLDFSSFSFVYSRFTLGKERGCSHSRVRVRVKADLVSPETLFPRGDLIEFEPAKFLLGVHVFSTYAET